MERLALSSSILYNRDILDKAKEIQKIKSSICPKIIYDSWEEFNELQKEAIKSCEKGITEMINSDEFEYSFMLDFGINPQQHGEIFNILCQAFNILTKNQVNKWVREYAGIVNLTILNTISSLVESGLWENIYDSLDLQGLIQFLTNIIRNTIKNGDYLDDCNNFGEKIRYFKCKKCNRIDVHLFDICDNCFENN